MISNGSQMDKANVLFETLSTYISAREAADESERLLSVRGAGCVEGGPDQIR